MWRQLRASQHQAAAEGRRRRAQQGRKPPRRQEPFLPNGCPALAPVKVHSPQLCHRLLNTLKNLLFLGCISIIILPPLPLLPFPSERDYVPSASPCQRTLAQPAAAAGRLNKRQPGLDPNSTSNFYFSTTLWKIGFCKLLVAMAGWKCVILPQLVPVDSGLAALVEIS